MILDKRINLFTTMVCDTKGTARNESVTGKFVKPRLVRSQDAVHHSQEEDTKGNPKQVPRDAVVKRHASPIHLSFALSRA